MDRQRLIFNSIDEGMIGINRKGMIDFINESACTMLEVSDFNAIGKSIFDIIPDSKLVRVLESGKSELNDELTLAERPENCQFPLSAHFSRRQKVWCICCV